MINEVSMSGVIFSHDLSTGAPYYVINYDDQSGRTDTITSGTADISRTLLVYRGQVNQLQSTRFGKLIRAVQEIENLTSASGLDIEFAVTKDEAIYIFQARRMSVSNNWNRDISRHVDVSLLEIRRFLELRFQPMHGVLGDTTLLGEMPDWNPAEMIGIVPRPLAKSLYEKLITNSVWAEARAEMGYRDLSGRPLMLSLGGRVFIDVRESFNSFLPADLPDDIGEKLVSAWLKKLRDCPEFHDKIEFKVVATALSLDFDGDISSVSSVLTLDEISTFRSSLLRLTNNIVLGRVADIKMQNGRIACLDERRREIVSQTHVDKLVAVRRLLRDCIKNGTLPFSILARQGFIAESLLRSIETQGILSAETIAAFRNSVPTVVSDFLNVMVSCQGDPDRRNELIRTYGHLRPGTYDILASRYDQHMESAESLSGISKRAQKDSASFSLTASEMRAVDFALSQNGFSFNSTIMFEFMREAIAGREYAKLVFTRNISDALEFIAEWGENSGLSREELSFVTIEQLLQASSHTYNLSIENHFRKIAKIAQDAYQVSQALRLPYLISDVSDIYVVPLLKSRPNFITSKRIQGPLHYLSDHAFNSAKCSGKIVLIERADPGYDWIFLSPIAGLITKYGGANSHMAIRCAELGIPAAIGCGEQIFESMQKTTSVLLDCAAGTLIPIHYER
jgi:phosphohistidine swiveling domain-containing protein